MRDLLFSWMGVMHLQQLLTLMVAIKVWHSYNKFENQVANVARQPYLAKI
jgi:hypothetical protein